MLGRSLHTTQTQAPANYARTLKSKSLKSMLQRSRDREIRRLRELVLSEIEQKAPLPGDQLDDARRHEEMDLHVSLIEMSERRLAAIFNAFERLEHGQYGICEACGDEISFERLRAMPTALYCVDCQAKLEAVAHKRGAVSASIEEERMSSDTTMFWDRLGLTANGGGEGFSPVARTPDAPTKHPNKFYRVPRLTPR